MAKLINKMLNLVGWEVEEEEEETSNEEMLEEIEQPQFFNPIGSSKKQNTKVVNLHTSSQFKLVVMQPETFDDAQGICDHLKSKKPVIVNLESLEKEIAQRIIDFLSGSVYTVDGNIQRVSSGIFIIAPNNVDITGDLSDELKNKNAFPWTK
jgi:cell division inhibitor SepF